MSDSSSDVTHSLVGRQLSSFRVDKLIKRGGMAEVYKGWDVMLERPVAIKVIDTRFRSNPAYAERFLREARAVATWRHEHIVQVYYADVQDGLYYFVMEYVDGRDLSDVIQGYLLQGEVVPLEDVVRIGEAVAKALAYAHRHGVVHRDVKPGNVMLAADGRVLLADFGLAMARDEGTETDFLGTPHYVAPEQAIRAGNAVPQSDLYSLGVMLYEMLVGVRPFDDKSLTGVAFQQIYEPPVAPRLLNPALNRETELVLLRALSKEPMGRYQTGEELMMMLGQALALGQRVQGDRVDLPPVPAAVHLEEEEGGGRALQVSRRSVVVHVTEQLLREERGGARQRAGFWWPWVVGVAGVLLVVVGFGLWWQGQGGGGETAVLPSMVPTVTREVLIAPIVVTEMVGVATRLLVTSTPLPTATGVPMVTETAVLPVPTLPPVPVLNGPPVQFFYNSRSFYLLNAGSVPLELSKFSFLAVDGAGSPAGYRFLGKDWATFYPQIDPGSCTRIEPIDYTSFVRPADCQRFNALVTPSLLDSTLFWLPHDRVVMFEVYWNGGLIGRCPVDVDQCTLYLPESAEQLES